MAGICSPGAGSGEIPMALVKLVPGAKVTEQDYINFLEKEGV